MEGLVAINGKLAPSLAEAKISVLDRGFLISDAVFEVIVAFGDKVLDLGRHLARLRASAQALAIPVPWSDEELALEIQGMVHRLGSQKSYVRLTLSRGEGLGLVPDPKLRPNKVVFCLPARVEHKSVFEKGLSLQVQELQYTMRGPLPKVGNYARAVLGLRKAEEGGFEDLLWVNSSGEITEASTANIFFIGRDGDLVEIATPAVESGILLGTTRARLIELLQRASIPVTERLIFQEEIPRFDEAFLCSTVRGLVPVNKVNSHRLHTRRPNSVFNQIERLYLSWAESQIGVRVNWNTGHKAEDLQ